MTIKKEYLGRIILSYGLFIGLGMTIASLGPLLNDFHIKTGDPLSRISGLFTARSIGGLSGALLGVRLFDHRSVKSLLMLILPAMALMFFLIPVFDSLLIIMALFLVTGFSHSMIDASGNLTVAANEENTGPLLSLLHFSFGVGALLIPLVINLFRRQEWEPIRALWVIGAVYFLLWVYNFFLKPVVTAGHKHAEKQQAAYPVWLLITTSVFFFFLIGIEVSFTGWLVNFAQDLNIFSEVKATNLISLYFGLYTGVRFLTAPLSYWMKNSTILLLSVSCSGGLIILLNIIPLGPVSLTAGTILLGIFLAPGFPMFLSMLQDSHGLSGTTTTFVMGGAFSGGMFFPWFIGQFYETTGPMIMLRILILNVAMALAMLLVIMKPRRRG